MRSLLRVLFSLLFFSIVTADEQCANPEEIQRAQDSAEKSRTDLEKFAQESERRLQECHETNRNCNIQLEHSKNLAAEIEACNANRLALETEFNKGRKLFEDVSAESSQVKQKLEQSQSQYETCYNLVQERDAEIIKLRPELENCKKAASDIQTQLQNSEQQHQKILEETKLDLGKKVKDANRHQENAKLEAHAATKAKDSCHHDAEKLREQLKAKQKMEAIVSYDQVKILAYRLWRLSLAAETIVYDFLFTPAMKIAMKTNVATGAKHAQVVLDISKRKLGDLPYYGEAIETMSTAVNLVNTSLKSQLPLIKHVMIKTGDILDSFNVSVDQFVKMLAVKEPEIAAYIPRRLIDRLILCSIITLGWFVAVKWMLWAVIKALRLKVWIMCLPFRCCRYICCGRSDKGPKKARDSKNKMKPTADSKVPESTSSSVSPAEDRKKTTKKSKTTK